MSAIDKPFGHWKEEGTYLAGWEVDLRTQAPRGWSLWVVPESTFATTACTAATYGDARAYIHNQFLRSEDYEPAGAVHEFYPADFHYPEKDTFYLYFTIREKKPAAKKRSG